MPLAPHIHVPRKVTHDLSLTHPAAHPADNYQIPILTTLPVGNDKDQQICHLTSGTLCCVADSVGDRSPITTVMNDRIKKSSVGTMMFPLSLLTVMLTPVSSVSITEADTQEGLSKGLLS